MKKNFRKIAFMLLTLVILCAGTVSADLGNGLNGGLLNDLTANNTGLVNRFETPLNNIFGTIFLVLKVLGVAGIVITGVKYMYASGNDRGQMKQSLIYIVIGTIFIFGAEIVVNLIQGAWLNVSV